MAARKFRNKGFRREEELGSTGIGSVSNDQIKACLSSEPLGRLATLLSSAVVYEPRLRMTNHPSTESASSKLPALLLATCTLIFCTSTLSFHARSGESGALLVAYGGLDPTPPMVYPIWSFLTHMADMLPMATMPFRFGLVSVLSAAVSTYLLCRILENLTFRYRRSGESPLIHLSCAIPATAYWMLSIPFQLSADRAHPVLFHVALLLLVLRGFQRGAVGERGPYLVLAYFVAGIGFMEWWGIALLTPILFILSWMTARGPTHDREAIHFLTGIAWLSGIVVALLLFFIRIRLLHPEEISTANLIPSLGEFMAAHVDVLRQESSIPGWSTFMIGAALPFCLAYYCARQNEILSPPAWSLLHLIFLVLAVTILSLGTINPFEHSSPHRTLSILSFLFSAGTFGITCAFWYALLDQHQRSTPVRMLLRKIVLPVAIMVLLVASSAPHFPRRDNYADRIITHWARASLRNLPDGTLLIGQGDLFHILLLTAAEFGPEIIPIDESGIHNSGISRTLRGRFDSSASHIMAEASPEALRIALLIDQQTASTPLAYLRPPNPVHCAWNPAVPSFGMYLANIPPSDKVWNVEEQLDLWKSMLSEFPEQHRGRATSLDLSWTNLRHHIARLANDLGVHLRNLQRMEIAGEAIQVALSFNPDNPIAQINGMLCAAKQDDVLPDDTGWNACQRLLLTPRRWYQPLVGYDSEQGELLHTERFKLFQQSLPNSIHDFPENGELKEACIRFLRRDPQARWTAERFSHSTPHLPFGGILLALDGLVNNASGDIEQGVGHVIASGEDSTPLLLAIGSYALDHGNSKLAVHYLKMAIKLKPADTEVLEAAMLAHIANGDVDQSTVYGKKLSNTESTNPWTHFYQGTYFLRKGYVDSAIEELTACARSRRLPLVNVQLADLLRISGRKSEAIRLAEEGLAQDTDSIGYWRRLGKLLEDLERTGLALFVNERVRLIESTAPGGSPLDLNDLLIKHYTLAFRSEAPNVAQAATVLNTNPERRDPKPHVARHGPSSTGQPAPEHSGTQTSEPMLSSTNDLLDDEAANIPLLW